MSIGNVNTTSKFNPFPGLRPFSPHESHLFFGREGQSEEVIYRLAKHKFVAVVGASGSGKSSLMYCGVTPILQSGFIAGTSWRVITARPGNSPIENMAKALVAADKIDRYENTQYREAIFSAVLRSSSAGLAEAVKQLQINANESVLVQVDQFEELFRFRTSSKDGRALNETMAFVKMLLYAVNQAEFPIFVILTMRSDFIGECSYYAELTDLINKSHYLIPQMTRADFKLAITGPVAVGKAQIANRLVNQLLNEITNDSDQLPILQHALMRTWDYWQQNSSPEELLDINHYNAIGRMEKALSMHANEAFEMLSDSNKMLCRQMFKALTEIGNDNRGIRRPATIKELARISGATIPDIIEIADVFREQGRSFVSPTGNKQLQSDTVIDISHESLMRIWDRLKVWVTEEAGSVQMYRRLAESAENYQLGKAGLWQPPELFLAVNWRESQKPNREWAIRHHAAFEQTMAYLETAELEFKAHEENKIRLQKQALQRSRIFAMVLGAAALISLGFLLYSFALRVEAENQRIEAERQRARAVTQSAEAEKQRTIAEEKSDYAVTKSNEAERERKKAEREKENALLQEQESKRNANLANAQRLIADQKSREADSSAKIATSQSILARLKSEEADRSAKQAVKLRMLSVARSMAVKSLQITQNKELQALLAYQSFKFNRQFEGSLFDNDIHNSVYYSLKALSEKDMLKREVHADAVRTIQFLPKSKTIVTAGADGKIRIGSLTDSLTQITDFGNNKIYWHNIQVAPDEQSALLTDNAGNIYLTKLGNTEVSLFSKKQEINGIRFLNENTAIVIHGDSITSFNLDDKSKSFSIKAGAKLLSLDIHPKSKRLVVGTATGALIYFKLPDLSFAGQTFTGFKNAVYAVAISPDGKLCAAGDVQGKLGIYDIKTNKLTGDIEGHNARISRIVFNPQNNVLITVSYDAALQFISPENNYSNPAVSISDIKTWILDVCIADEKIIIAYKSGMVQLFDANIAHTAAKLYAALSRNFTLQEWQRFVGADIKYQPTRADLPFDDKN
ncbi:MAG TPA: hypothetical protein DCQ31_17195 [Bacteroidales bacterium]|nr:hypothetical protein [Bacteroidales bacterium]